MGEVKSKREFRFCIDRGGTFTDVYAEVGANMTLKSFCPPVNNSKM